MSKTERTIALAQTVCAILKSLTPMKNSEHKYLDPQHEPAWPWELEATRKFKADRARERRGQRQNVRRGGRWRTPWVGDGAAVLVIAAVFYFACIAI